MFIYPNVSKGGTDYTPKGMVNVLERVKINFLSRCWFCIWRKKRLVKYDKKQIRLQNSCKGTNSDTLVLTEGIYFIDSLLTVPGKTCLIMDE